MVGVIVSVVVAAVILLLPWVRLARVARRRFGFWFQKEGAAEVAFLGAVLWLSAVLCQSFRPGGRLGLSLPGRADNQNRNPMATASATRKAINRLRTRRYVVIDPKEEPNGHDSSREC